MINAIVSRRYLIAFFVFITLVIGKLHGSSLSEWDTIVKEKIDKGGNTLIVGKSRGIRSDEWQVQTPMYLSQVASQEFFPVINPAIRSDGQNMLVSYYAPVFDITLIGKPFNWGFMLLGGEYGLSWYWYSKLILLFLLSFEISMFFSDRNVLLSLIGAYWITFSPGLQWWFGAPHTDQVIFSQAIIVAVWHYLRSQSKKQKLALSAMFASSVVGYILTAYPPVLVPLGFFTSIVLFFILCSDRQNIHIGRYDYFPLSLVLLIIGASLYSYVARSFDAIHIMQGTVYPGSRFVTGGNFDVRLLQLYLINWLLPFKDVIFWNNCEVATNLSFLPALMIVFVKVYRLEENKKALMLALSVYLIFQMTWLAVSYPDWVAKYTLFSYVLEDRLQLTINLTALYMSIWAFSLLVKHKPLGFRYSIFFSVLITLFYGYCIYFSPMAKYLELIPGGIVLTLLFFLIMNFAFLEGMEKLFVSCIVIYISVAGLTVNPISRGLDAIYNKAITQKILSLKERDPDAKWMVNNSPQLGNFLVALGVKSFNSVHYYPDLKTWDLLDPGKSYFQIYNRYAHVQVQLTNEQTYFKLVQKDYFILFLNINDLKKTGVKYILSRGQLTTPLLREVDYVWRDALFIYEVGVDYPTAPKELAP